MGKVYLDSDDELDKTYLSTRSSPQTFSQATYHILSTSSLRAFVQRMKFGKTLKLHIEVIPANLAWNILSCYDIRNKCLLLNEDRIDIIRDLVFEIYGFPKVKEDQRWLFQRTKGNPSVIEYYSTKLLKKVDDEHLRLKIFGYHFDNEERFFCENKDSEVNVLEFETHDMLLLENEENDEENSESDNTLIEPEENENEGMDDSENTKDYFMLNVLLDELETSQKTIATNEQEYQEGLNLDVCGNENKLLSMLKEKYETIANLGETFTSDTQIQNVEQQEDNLFQHYPNQDINDTVKNIAKSYTAKENEQIEAMFEEPEADRLLKEKVMYDSTVNEKDVVGEAQVCSEAYLVNEKEDNVADIENENEENVTTEETVNELSAQQVKDGFLEITSVAHNITASEPKKKSIEFDEKLIEESTKVSQDSDVNEHFKNSADDAVNADDDEDVCIIIDPVESSGFIDEEKKDYVEKEIEKIQFCEKREEENLNAQEKKNKLDFKSFGVDDLYNQSGMNENFTSSKWQEVFKAGIEKPALKIDIETLETEQELYSQVIDNFITVLNYEEKMTNKKFLRRHFFNTIMMSEEMQKLKNNEKAQIELFHTYVVEQFEKKDSNIHMKEIELPGLAVIIDNSDANVEYKAKYKETFEFVRDMFVTYLRHYEHHIVEKLESLKEPQVLELR
ncbi:hypothetical protein Tco_1003169 [Tanacetum coccineum]|uniref:Uncharacterized protein n=1 Tax=Tanacetum coccineum TaxID=301880 RepID=A0ABQ5F8K2_9ASTR